jgi:hypothetical protein
MPSNLIRLLMLLLLAPTQAGCDLPSTGDPSTRSAYAIEHFFKDPGAQALGIAAEHGNVAEVRRLMQQEHVDPDVMFASDDSGMPLLAWPIYTKSLSGLEAMLDNGADPNARKPGEIVEKFQDGSVSSNYRYTSAMVIAARQEDPIYLAKLLEHGGDPNTRNRDGESLLFQAFIWHNQWQNVRLLVEKGADPDAKTAGWPILLNYAAEGNFEAVYWLLQHGADPRSVDHGEAPGHRYMIIDNIFWYPGTPRVLDWQRKCQHWLLSRGITRPPMPDSLRHMRQNFNLPSKEEDIPLL